jgi:hypothetical protein
MKGRRVTLTELAVALAVASGTVAGAATALDVPVLVGEATRTAELASCRTVETAVVAYVAEHDTAPVRMADLFPLLRGDVTGYRLLAGGAVTGPGCDTAD